MELVNTYTNVNREKRRTITKEKRVEIIQEPSLLFQQQKEKS
jgi:hypothetical protein